MRERPETAQRTPYIFYENNNCNAIVSEVCEKMRVTCKLQERAQFKHCYKFFADTLNIARIVALFEKIYDEQPILIRIPSSQISGRMYCILSNTAISVKCTM